jgi:hypothetical protein
MMRVRAWMAAVAIVTGTSATLGLLASTPRPDQAENQNSTDRRTSNAEVAKTAEPPLKNEDSGAQATATDTEATSEAPIQDGTGDVVKLELWIAGLGQKGCDVEIKPGHAGCKFRPQTRHIASSGKSVFTFRDVEVRSADRDCGFAITVKEPGQATRTIHRGFRLAASKTEPGANARAQAFTCYLSSPSRLSRAEEATIRR